MGSIAMEEYELMKDSKYRVYVSAVDKALKNFEYTSEWADLISALGKLNKVLLNYMKFPVIPRRIKISKRLAQCMHPALPSGVHLKALETYDIIFKCMGTNRLSHELFIYSAGLFPLLGHAAMNVRPSLLTVYETHFVPLGERLQPGLSGFLSGVLPGLEEGSDHFERTTSLLEKVCEGVGPPHFYGCLWDCLAANSGIRLPAISFVLSHFNKKLSMEDQLYIMGTNIDVMVSALCAGVQDNSVLVQRSALDLLLVGFPMHNSQLVRSDMVHLVTAALVTILRRDMSLNRRLFAWLLGSEVNTNLLGAEHPLVKRPSNSSNYFDMYSKDMLIQAVKITLSQSLSQNPADVRPYRLLVSLLDKPDIGPVILDDILFEVFRTLYLSCGESDRGVGCVSASSGTRSSHELLKAANLLFSSLEPCYIWQYTGTLFSNACLHQNTGSASSGHSTISSQSSDLQGCRAHVRPVGNGPPDLAEVCQLTEFLLDSVSLEAYVETPGEHLPGLFLHIITQLTEGCGHILPSEVARSLQLCAKILTRVQPPVLAISTDGNQTSCDVREPKSLSNVSLESSPIGEPTSAPLEQRSKSTSDLAAADSNRSKTSKSSRVKKLNAKLRLRQSKGSPLLLSVQPLEPELETSTNNGSLNTPLRASTGNLTDLDNMATRAKCDSQVPNKELEMEIISVPVPSRQQSLLEQCVRQYEQFYVKFVGGQGVIRGEQVDEMFKELLVSHPRETDVERTIKLEALLAGEAPPNSWCMNSVHKSVPLVTASSGYEQWEEPMRVACSLLVELSTFPNYCLPGLGCITVDTLGDINLEVLPEWLRVLVVLACWLTTTPSLQLLAIGTLLDLMSLVRAPGCCVGTAAAGGSTPVVMVPLLKTWHLHFLEYRTCVVEVLARALWQHLGQLQPQLQLSCVELLHQLHNVLPASDAVEDIVGEALTQDGDDKKMEALQHFSLLWHLGRELEAKSGPGRTLRTFDRSLLKMLDHLQHPESCPLRLQSQAWLLHSLVRGDVARLLDPLLILLLEPNTARLSVLHVSIQHSNTVVTGSDTRTSDGPDERASARIYAISSVDGNVIYHVSEDNSCRKGQQRSASDDPVRAKRIFAVTTLVGGDTTKHYITEKTPHLREIDFPTSFLARQNISVFVNPFAASHASESAPEEDCIPETRERSASMPDFLRHATRLHPPGRSLSGSTSGDAGPLEETEVASFNSKDSGNADSPKEHSGENDMSESSGSSSSGSTEGADGPQGRCWSAVDDELGEPEESTAAEDYFRNTVETSSINVVQDILKEVLDKVAKQCAESNETRLNGRPISSGSMPSTSVSTAAGVHPLHSHMLLYCGVYDSGRALYALRTLRAVLLTHARMFLCAAAATGLAGQQAAGRRAAGLQALLARHRKSVFGRSFHGDLNSLAVGEYSAAYRSSMYLEVLVSVCLYYARSFYPNLGQMRLTQEEIAGNRQVQLASAELLMLMCSELIVIVRDSGRGFACYLADLLVRCKVQKVVLHCVVASVYDMSCVGVKASQRTFTEEIVCFNDPVIETNDSVTKCRFRSSEHSEGFQIQLLRLLLALLMLEHQVNLQKGDDATHTSKEPKETPTPTKNPQQKYTAGVAIPEQPMFLSGILSALKMEHMRHLHQQWTALVTSALPFMGPALTPVVMSVVSQLCCNLERLSQYYCCNRNSSPEMMCCLPPDYTVTQLESLTLLCHYCLLDSAQQQSHAFSQPLLGGVGSAGIGAPGAGPGQVFSNLVHVFMPSPLQQEAATTRDKPGVLQDTLTTARLTMLSNLPRIIASVAALWQAVLGTGEREQQSCVLGSARIVKHQLLELLSPISLHHGTHFLAAVAVAWKDRRPALTSTTKVVPVAGPEQQVLVSLVGALRVLPMDTLVQTVHSVLRQPPPIQGAKQDLSLEVSLLELFYCCLKGCAGAQLAESWGSLLPLLRDGLTLSPPAQFLLLAVLSEYVHRCPPLAERKDQRDLQDITAKLVESCAQIAGACLEQTTWLRRNLAVREEEPNLSTGRDKDNGGASTSVAGQFSVQAQSVLAELLAPLLDVSYGSQEKEKVVALLTGLMYNITPYLKNHTRRNVPSFQACSQLLSSLSSYQYTRKAWRRDVFDLLLDPSLFQMEAHCLPLWRTIVDNLMTHDNTTFRDLMSRVSLAQSGSLSIFSSREQEYEQRAQLLKRLAFVLLCSEMDQYHKYMPEIQERLADSLRLPQVVPTVQAQVFLCFRVLLLRMSSQHVTSLWPIIISELVQVFLHIEQELSTDSEEFRRNNSSHIRLLSALDSSWVVNSNNGLHAHGHPAWLQLQLSAAKLLDLALALPAHRLPQFQMYRWAFVGGSESSLNNNQLTDEPARPPDFIPHVARIAKLMVTKFGGAMDPLPRLPGQLLLRASSIRTVQELHPFFTSLSTYSSSPALPDWGSSLGQLEAALETDFLERLPSK